MHDVRIIIITIIIILWDVPLNFRQFILKNALITEMYVQIGGKMSLYLFLLNSS